MVPVALCVVAVIVAACAGFVAHSWFTPRSEATDVRALFNRPFPPAVLIALAAAASFSEQEKFVPLVEECSDLLTGNEVRIELIGGNRITVKLGQNESEAYLPEWLIYETAIWTRHYQPLPWGKFHRVASYPPPTKHGFVAI